MSGSLYSSSWYRVADLKPRLRAHVRIYRQIFRGQLWYVLQDQASGRYNRFTPAAYLLISLMDGRRTVQELWDIACTELSSNVPTQNEIVGLLSQLHQADALHADVMPNVAKVSERVKTLRWKKLLMSMANPMAIRIPLLDPDRFLNATMPVVRPLYSWPAILTLIAFVSYSAVLAASHWQDIASDIGARILAGESLLLLLLTYPLVKALHELGHAYAVKRWGGEVHEIGLMFLVFVPVPYVDASASSAFPEKTRRAFVALAGIAVELVLASIALQIWLNTHEGLLHAFAFNTMVIGGVSTLLVNGNPLLRFDGYYAMTDLLEIPNLATRANNFIGYLVQHYAFGVETAESPVSARGEAAWLATYAVSSFVYRLVLVFSISLFVASRFFFLGILLAIWGLILMLVFPVGKQVYFLLCSPVLRERRTRALVMTGCSMALLAGVLLLVPLPHSTIAPGVLWVPGDGIVHAGTEGTVVRLLASPHSIVAEGEPIIELTDPLLDARVKVQEAKTEGLRLRHAAANVKGPAMGQMAMEELRQAETDLALLRQRQGELIVRSQTSGEFIVAQPMDLVGGFVRKGDALGHVLSRGIPIVQVMVAEEDADFARRRIVGVELRLAHNPRQTLRGSVTKEVPMLTDQLPSPALGTLGGGDIVMDPADPKRKRMMTKALQFEIGLADPLDTPAWGERVYVRIRHDDEALAYRLYRSARQIFLSRLNV